jgi:hypothetical protein
VQSSLLLFSSLEQPSTLRLTLLLEVGGEEELVDGLDGGDGEDLWRDLEAAFSFLNCSSCLIMAETERKVRNEGNFEVKF